MEMILAKILIMWFSIGNIIWALKHQKTCSMIEFIHQWFIMVVTWPYFLIK